MHNLSTRLFSRRTFLRGTAAGALALATRDIPSSDAVGAAGSPAGYPPPNPGVVGERAALNIWLDPAYAGQPAYKQAISLFQKTYPTISVHVTPVPQTDMLNRYKLITAAGGGGVAPDLISDHGYIYGAQGLAHESDALWSSYGRQSDFLPTAIDDVQWRSDKFGIPLTLDPVLTIVNAAMFGKAGVPLPTSRTTFAQFTELVVKVQQANGARYAMILSADGATATAVVHANGGALYKQVAGRNIATLTDTRVTDALRFYTELGWKRRLAPIPPTASSSRAFIAQLFADRQAPAFFGTIADLALIRAVDSSLSPVLAPLPGGTGGHTAGSVNAGLSLVLTAATKKPHAAFELATWMVAEPVALAVAKSMDLAPTVTAYYANSYFHRSAQAATFTTAAQSATPVGLDAYSEAYDLYMGALHASFGGGNPAALLAAIQSRCQTAMDKADAGIDSDG